jgi:esterase
MSGAAAPTPPAASVADETLHHTVMDDGVRVAWRRRRAQAMPARGAVLLLHGLASNMSRWAEQAELSALPQAGWDLIRVDLRGHGESPTRGAIGLPRWCDDLAQLLAAAGHARAVLVGHSLGAQVALAFAARHPARLQALLLIDPVFRAALHGKWERIARLGPLFHAAALGVRALNALGLRRRSLPPLDLREMDRQARIALRTPAAEAAFIAHYSSTRADLRCFRTAHYLQELVEMFRPVPPLAGIGVPTHVLLSTGATFAQAGEMRALLAQLPRGSVADIDCHHWPVTERPDEVRAQIEAFCATLAAA